LRQWGKKLSFCSSKSGYNPAELNRHQVIPESFRYKTNISDGNTCASGGKKENLGRQSNENRSHNVFFIWLTGLVFLIIATSDFFTEPPFKRTYFTLWLLLFSSTITMLPVIRNYFRNKKLNKNKTVQ